MPIDHALSTTAFFQSLEDGVVITDLDGIVAQVNDHWCSVIGRSVEELVGKDLPIEWWPNGDAHSDERHVFLDTPKPEMRERVVKNAAGELLPVLVSLSLVRDKEGNNMGYLLVFRDISEQKQVEHKLQTQNEQLAAIRQAIDISVDAIISIDGDQKIVLFNIGAEETFGYSAVEVMGESLDKLLPDRFRSTHERFVADFRDGDVPARRMDVRREIFGRRKDGTEFPAEASISRLGSGSLATLTVILRDITDQKRFEQQLQQQNEELAAIRQAVDISVDAIIAIDETQHITLFNTGAEDTFGYTAEEVIGTPLERLIPERYRKLHSQYVGTFRTGDVPARRMDERREIFGLRKDGSEFPAEASISRRVSEKGANLTVILRDITQRKRFEERLSEKNAALAKAMQAKDTFLANMSHELRTPLNSIIGFTGILLMKLPGSLNDNQEQQLRIVQNSGRHLLSIINDLLDLAKIESGKVEISLEPVDCADVVDEVLRSLNPIATTKGIPLSVESSDTHVVVWSDRRALGQIVINLVNNAVKFTDAGEVRVVVSKHAQEVAIDVIDTGPGISAEDQERIFGAFERTTASTSRSVEGTGLGLHICMKLAELIGAQIELSSDVGVGSTFTVRLQTQGDN